MINNQTNILITLKRKTIIGENDKDFKLATQIILNLKMLDRMPWADILVPDSDNINVDTVCATLVKCYNTFWTFNPCLIVCKENSKREKNILYIQVFEKNILFILFILFIIISNLHRFYVPFR